MLTSLSCRLKLVQYVLSVSAGVHFKDFPQRLLDKLVLFYQGSGTSQWNEVVL